MAASPDTRELYPLTSPGGDAIPYDVFRPFGLLLVDIDDTVSSDVTIPDGAELLLCYSTMPCIVRLGTDLDASIPASGSHLSGAFYLPAEVHLIIDPNQAAELTVIGTTADAGILYINTTKRWKDLQTAARLNRT